MDSSSSSFRYAVQQELEELVTKSVRIFIRSTSYLIYIVSYVITIRPDWGGVNALNGIFAEKTHESRQKVVDLLAFFGYNTLA